MNLKNLIFPAIIFLGGNAQGDEFFDSFLNAKEDNQRIAFAGSLPGMPINFNAFVPKNVLREEEWQGTNARDYASLCQKFTLPVLDFSVYNQNGIKFPYERQRFDRESEIFTSLGIEKKVWLFDIPVWLDFNHEEREKGYGLVNSSLKTYYEVMQGISVGGSVSYVMDNSKWQGMESYAYFGIKLSRDTRLDGYFQKSWGKDSWKNETGYSEVGIKLNINF